jgi:regulator of PEP synthase PpsR (kinase-PPPase family)
MTSINECEKSNLKLNSEKSNLQNLINGVKHIISTYELSKDKSKILYQTSLSKYNMIKNNVESLESELNREKYSLNTLDKVLNINYNLYVKNEESLNKYNFILEEYERKLRTIEIDLKINEMQKAIFSLQKEKENYI